MNPRILWQTELPPVLDVTRGPINGAAQRDEATGTGQRTEPQCSSPSGIREAALQDDPAAAPPEPTYVPGVGFLPRHEPTPADMLQERAHEWAEQAAWVPWSWGECPVPREARCDIRTKHGHYRSEYKNQYVASLSWWESGEIVAYRLANPTPRGPCTLSPDHPHAELARLYTSDDTLRVWVWNSLLCEWLEKREDSPLWREDRRYHVGHQLPKEGA